MFQKPQHIIHMLYHNIYGRTPSLAVEEQNTFYLTKSVLILFNNVDCWYKKRNVCDHLQFCNIQKMLQETSDIASGFWPPGVPLGQQIGGGGSGELLLAGHHLQKKERQIKNMSVLVFTSNFAYLGTGLALCTACFLCSATFTSAHSVSNGHEVRTSPPATPLDICLPALSPWSPPPSLPSPFSSPGNISFERDLNIYMNVWNFIPKYSTRINSQYPSLITSNFSLSIALLSVHSSGPRTIVTTSLRRIL